MPINLNVPYLSQRDNEFSPSNTCNVTCVAMCLEFFGIKPLSKPQLEDELFLEVQHKGWDRYTHDDLDKLIRFYGINNYFTTDATWQQVKSHLDSGNPVIMSGAFTRSGHIIVLRGYDETGFWVNDPWGEWFATGYQNRSGENLHYSYKLCNQVSYGKSISTWAHFPQPYALPVAGLALIKEFEGCNLNAYPDPLSGNKPITIGWGATETLGGGTWKLGDSISQKEADDLLILQLQRDYLPSLEKIPGWKQLSQNQQGALLSFAYNLGANFYNSNGFDSMTAMLKTHNWSIARETFLKYCNPGTSVEEGLKRRRLSETNLFLKR